MLPVWPAGGLLRGKPDGTRFACAAAAAAGGVSLDVVASRDGGCGGTLVERGHSVRNSPGSPSSKPGRCSRCRPLEQFWKSRPVVGSPELSKNQGAAATRHRGRSEWSGEPDLPPRSRAPSRPAGVPAAAPRGRHRPARPCLAAGGAHRSGQDGSAQLGTVCVSLPRHPASPQGCPRGPDHPVAPTPPVGRHVGFANALTWRRRSPVYRMPPVAFASFGHKRPAERVSSNGPPYPKPRMRALGALWRCRAIKDLFAPPRPRLL